MAYPSISNNSPLTIPLSVANGGTGATTALAARANLGLTIGTNVLAPNGSGTSLTGVAKTGSANTFSDTTDSTQTTNGAQIISGGVGIAKNLNVGAVLKVWNTTEATASVVGSIVTLGGIFVTKKVYANQLTSVTDATVSGLTLGAGPSGSGTNVVLGNTTSLGQGNGSTLSNVVVGSSSLAWATGAAIDNVVVGTTAGSTQTSGAGSHVTLPISCIYIGTPVYTGSTTPTNEIVIGCGAIGSGSNTTTLGVLGSTTRARVIGTGINQGYFYGLTLSNAAGDPTNDITIAAGECRDSTGVVTMTLSSTITKQLDASWAVGNNQGGLDTGSIANTTYHLWLIMRPDTGVVDMLFSTSVSSPTMPANYTYKRRIGSIVRAGGTILAFTQDGNDFTLTTPVLDISTTTLSTARTTYTLASVPTGIRMRVKLRAIITNASATAIWIGPTSETDSAPSTSASPLFNLSENVASKYGAADMEFFCDTSAQIAARSFAASTTLRVVTRGWVDSRNRY